MQDTSPTDRAAVQLSDVLLTFLVLVAIVATAPFWYKFIDMVDGSADPFSNVLLQLAVPMLILTLIASVGVSARGG